MQNASLESVCSEFLCLQRLIKGAARAATVEGTLLPAIPSQASLSQANSLLPGEDRHISLCTLVYQAKPSSHSRNFRTRIVKQGRHFPPLFNYARAEIV